MFPGSGDGIHFTMRADRATHSHFPSFKYW